LDIVGASPKGVVILNDVMRSLYSGRDLSRN